MTEYMNHTAFEMGMAAFHDGADDVVPAGFADFAVSFHCGYRWAKDCARHFV